MRSRTANSHCRKGRDFVIEPKILTELAEKALQEAKDTKNPYLRAVMARFAGAALELKVALESEVRGS